MGAAAVHKGDVSKQVSANIQRIREQRHLSQRQLAERLGELGHPMQASALAKVEGGTRRVDVDDLLAFAAALNVPPNRLLLPDSAGDDLFAVTPALSVTSDLAWDWANGIFHLFAADAAHDPLDWETHRGFNALRAPASRLAVEEHPAVRAVRLLDARMRRVVGSTGTPKRKRLDLVDGVRNALEIAATELDEELAKERAR